MINNSVVIVVPALNPDEKLIQYIESLIKCGASKMIVVDDGSNQEHKAIFNKIDEYSQCDVIVHEVNQGKGRALKDAMKFYKEHYWDSFCGIITVDSDGQHTVTDVEKLSNYLTDKTNCLVLGEREFDKDVPLRSKFGNSCTSFIFSLLYGIRLHDTQTGLRGIPNSRMDLFESLEGERYEYEMNMLMACSKYKIAIQSVTIQTIYIDDNAESHFRPIVDSFKIYKLIFKTFFKYMLVSLSSFLIDIILFELGILVLGRIGVASYIIIATVLARVCSSVYNYLLNKTVVFQSKEKTSITIIKYYVLCVGQMLISAFAVNALFRILPFPEVIVKVIVDTILFCLSYWVQKNLIFTNK